MTASVHARGIVIAGALAALALALGFVTLAMNQTASQASPHVIVPLKDRHHSPGSTKAATKTALAVKKKVVKKRPDVNLVAALKAGLPRSVAEGLAKRPVVVVELWSSSDPVGKLSAGEAEAGAALAGAAFVGVDVDADGGAAGVLTAALGKIQEAPAALVYTRPATLEITLPGFNDRTAVQQAASTASPAPVTAAAVSPEWATTANAICDATYAKVRALGGASTLTPAQGKTIYSGMYKKLAALKPPAGSAATVTSANGLLKQSIALLAQAMATQAAGQAAKPIYVHATNVMTQWSAKYNKLGATTCTATS